MKKLCSFLLAMVCLMVLVPVLPASAAATVVYTDDFENNWNASGTFGSQPTTSTSEIFFNGQNNGTFMAVEGYDSTEENPTTALGMFGTESGAAISYFNMKPYVNTFGLDANKALVLTMKFKMVGTPTSAFKLQFRSAGSGGSGFLDVIGDDSGSFYLVKNASYAGKGDKVAIETGAWYDLVVKFFTEVSGENTVIKAVANVYDEDGKLVKSTTESSAPKLAATDPMYIHATGGLTTTTGAVLDEAKLYSVANTDTFSVTEKSTDASNKIAKDGSITLKFDQPVAATKDMFTVKKASDGSVVDVIESVTVNDFNTVTVKFAGLADGTGYTLDYSAVTSAAGTAITDETKEVSFSTPFKPVVTQSYDGTFDSNYFKGKSEVLWDGQWNGTYEAVEDATYGKGVKMFTSPEITKNPSYAHVKTYTLSKFGLSDSANLVFTTRFKVEGESASNVSWSINPNSTPYALGSIYGGVDGKYTIDGDEHRPLTTGKWYNMTVLLKTTGRNEMIIADSQTGEVLTYKTAAVPANMANQMLLIQTTNLSEGSTLTVCDTTMYCTENTDTFNFVAEGSSAENTEIAIDEGITLKFDKPILGRELNSELAAVLMASVNNGASIREVRVVDFDTAVVTFAGLNNMSDYVLDFSSMKSAGGNALSEESVKTLAFKTGMDEDNDVTVVGGVNCSGTSVGDTVKFTLCTPSADITNVSFVVAFFDSENSKMIGAELVPEQNISATPNEYTVPVEKDYTGADSVKVIILESFSTLRPLIRDINSAIE